MEKIVKSACILICIFALLLSSWIVLSMRQRGLYDRENYNCEHQTIDLKRFFESLGFDADKVVGHRYDIPGDVKTITVHSWLRLHLPFNTTLDIESTSLKLCNYSDKYFVSSVK